ncbi:unnamed protein product [Cyclocybe aegerita]|uniref:Uncharacterized protein n=1 Tax=Cyclocybe aegerita TaxID=1973307 RepID=A0A8S0W6R6_CYCAE|nr:unnamed protein product [Cyclocybe aegerita]
MTEHGTTEPQSHDREQAIKDMRACIERLEKVVEDAVEAKSTVTDVLERLKGAGATHKEAEDFGKQFIQLFKARHGSVEGPGSQQIEGEREGTPEGLNEDEAAEFRRKRDSLLGEQPQGNEEEAARRRRAVDAAEWQLVLVKLATVAARPDSSAGKGSFSELLKIFDRSSASTSRSIPSTVLDGAPHLRNLSSNAIKDPHLDETWRLRLLFAGKETIDSIVDHLQAQPVDQPLPRSIWRLLVQDQYVDFEKLFASMDPNYNHNDDPKDFGGGFALVKKELATAKKTLWTEADWIRVFAAWREGTILLYPHRLEELQAYSRLVSDVFRACPNDPSNGICFDLESHQRYAKSPYRLDDKAQSFVSILGQVFHGTKRQSDSSLDGRLPPKHPTVPCYNCNLVSVVVSTEQETSRRAMLLSKLAEEKELALAAQRVADLAAVGPKQFVKTDANLKRPAAAPLDVPPRYRRGFVWSNSASLCESPATLLTLSAPPLPSPPSHLIDDPALISSLSAMQGFVKVDTPFNVDRLESLLSDHPNRPFVDSVIRGLREGFWPFEDGDWDKDATEPLSNFASEVEDLDAIRAFRDKELAAERWSDPLPITDLLPGMMSSPMFVAWQKEKPRVITDHSASGLNDGIPRTEAKVHYDDMRTFGQILFNARLKKLGIEGLLVYMDDFYGWDFADNLIKFRGRRRPRRQVLLLTFWEAIGCPYEDRKQEDGDCLKIIGFWVDPNRGSISLPPDSVDTIVTHITSFLAHPKCSPILHDWQRLGGHLNWLFNVLPCGRPALSGLFRKIRGKTHSSSPVFLNRTVCKELTWLAGVIRHAIGVHFVDSLNWTDDKADIVLWMDASLRLALSFYYSGNGFVYQLQPPPPGTAIDIFFLELIAIMSAIFHVASFKSPPRRILLFTDSLDAVGLLNLLAASEDQHNAPLLGIAEVILTSGVDLRVRHIPGKDNIRADMLSRLLLEDFHRRFPADRVQLFDPPRVLLPACWRECF